ncbi:hypothetical protein B0H19DRAFT_1382236 [Mycena capillaripes]|nr:hypothetical protein B0H19DRAFT_1382236 [Mycena capillaripes]
MSELNSYDEEEDALNRGVDRTKLLPPEILTEIFRFSSIFAEDQFLEPRHPPWILGQICGRWRTIALCTPRLWCSLMIVSSSVESLPIASILSLVSTYIERSGQLPLKLALDAKWSQVQKVPLLDLLLRQSHRWGDVSISRVDVRQGFGRSILAALQNNTLALQNLRFHRCSLTGQPSSITLPNLTSLTLVSSGMGLLEHLSTPGLQHLRLQYSFLRSSDHKSGVNSFLRKCASSLTRLGLSNSRVDDHELLNLLNILPNLTELDIYCAVFGTLSEAFLLGLHSQKTVPCVLPKLKYFSLGGTIYGSSDLLLDVLESRCPKYGNDEMACAPLLSVQLHPFKQFDGQARARLRALSDSGMDVGVFEILASGWVRVKEPDMEMDSEGSGEEARRGEM